MRTRRPGRLNRWLFAAACALVAVGAGVAVWAAFFSDHLAVRAVVVTGAERLSQQEIVGAAQVPMGASQLLVDTNRIADRVAGLREVRAVDVERVWPDEIAIRVSERQPAVQIPVGSSYLIADSQGVVFTTADSSTKGLATLQSQSRDAKVIAGALSVVASLDSTLAKRLEDVRADTYDSISLTLSKGVTIFWGSPEQNDLKNQVALALVKDGASSIDVSAPNHPVRK
ncbi:MAG: FtsQ-type POTRA domain-containing protein [Propionibacteriaceae bacterium]|jgi:cell division protein FtsQ|nr:FtsQ-type POTRA domain-containing protein [Propionibacteriaceae bacterium]